MRDSMRAARAYDLFMAPLERLFIRRWRRILWQEVRGPRVLEIGCGTGVSIPFYPPGLAVTALDRSRPMLDRAQERLPPDAGVTLVEGDAGDLPFPDGSFDEAVAAFVFCSVRDPEEVLRELHRVLTPGSPIHLLEHGRSRGRLGQVMDAAAGPLYRLTGDHIARDIAGAATRTGFSGVRVHHLLLDVVKIIRAAKDWGGGGGSG